MNKLIWTLLLLTPLKGLSAQNSFDDKLIQNNIERRLPETGVLSPQTGKGTNKETKSKIVYSYQCHVEDSVVEEKVVLGKPEEVTVSGKAEKQFVVSFKSGQSSVEDEIKRTIFGYLEKLKYEGTLSRVHIVGHTDSDKLSGRSRQKYGDNVGLSKQRAQKVASFVSESYPDVKVSYNGYGFFRPIASNSTRSGKVRNRRVEVNFYLNTTKTVITQGVDRKVLISTPYAKVEDQPFRITLDGEPLTESKVLKQKSNVDVQRCTDVALEGSSVQIKYEPIENSKYLNVTQGVVDGKAVFHMNSNYGTFIEKAELILTHAVSGKVLGKSTFKKTGFHFKDLSYGIEKFSSTPLSFVVRAYDVKGRFDETVSQFVEKTETPIDYSNSYQNRVGISGITPQGGLVTVVGDKVPESHTVHVMGREIPVDKSGKFAESQILPLGENYGIEVSLKDSNGKGVFLKRDLNMPKNNWRAIGLADVTVGQNKSDGPVNLTEDDINYYDNQVFLDGRLALYIKGKIRGKYLLTMQVDTLESTLEDSFDNINDKDPQKLFRRIDPDAYYPIYGDDSTLIEDAPSQGKFYVRIDKGENHILWGNFKVNSSAENLAGVQRGLYGLKLHLETASQTKRGDKVAKLDGYAAEPGTLPVRLELRGNNGTFYILRNQDIVEGSERVQIIVRDRVSGVMIGTRSLTRGTDYTLNAISGFLILNTPLLSEAGSNTVVSNNNITGNPAYLAVNYEYNPTFTDIDTLAIGGRGELSLGDHLRLGATGSKQDYVDSKYEIVGADATIHMGRSSSLKFEGARSKGFTPNQFTSIDGGFAFNQTQTVVDPNAEADALRAEANLKLYTVANRSADLKAVYSTKEAGFASPGHLSIFETVQATTELNLPLNSWLSLKGRYGLRDQDQWLKSEEKAAEIGINFTRSVSLEVGALKDEILDQSPTSAPTTTLATDFGERTDLGVKLKFASDSNWSIYGIGQQTVTKDDTRLSNDRYGLGASAKLGKSFKLAGEVTDGDLDFGGKLETTYIQNENTSFYVNYLLENNRTDGGFAPREQGRNGSVTSGVKSKFLENSQVFYENRLADQFGTNRSQSLTHAMGLDWTLNKHWNYNITSEFGRVENQDLSTRIDRAALSGSIGFLDKNTKWTSALEYRKDESGNSTRKTVVTKNRFIKKLTESWRLKTKFDMLSSEASGGQFFDGDLTDAVVAFAYRPILNDAFNGLFKLRYFESLPAAGQVDASGQAPEFLQRSTVLNMDGIWDLSTHWSLGVKYGTRRSRQRNVRQGSGEWFDSNVHLGILRFDYHAPFKWDIHLEGRTLALTSVDEVKSGALVGLYRNFSNSGTLKLGAGYNFTDFSNDLTRTDFSYEGWFVNLVGAF